MNPLLAAGALFVAIFLSLTTVGCGGGSADSTSEVNGGPNAKTEAAREDAMTAKDAAETAGAAKFAAKEWEKALAKLDDAESAYESGDPKAGVRFRSAKGWFDKATKIIKTNRKHYADAEKYQKQYEEIRDKLQSQGLAKQHPERFKRAEEHYKDALELVREAKDSKGFKKARIKFRDAYDEMDSLSSRVALAADEKGRADKAREEMELMKKRALEAGADKTEIANFELGTGDERKGDDFLATGDYTNATYSFRTARDWYVAALDDAKRREVAMANSSASDSGFDDNPDISEEAPDIGEIEIPEFEDEGADLDIVSNLSRLFSVEPDYRDGILSLEYPFGADFRKDVSFVARSTGKKRHLIFEGAEGVGIGFGTDVDMDDPDFDPDDVVSYTFAGNTRGLLLLDCSFEDMVKIEFDVRFQLVLPDQPLFLFMVNSNQKGTSYYGSSFGSDLVIATEKKAPVRTRHKNPEFKKTKQLWVLKTKDYHYAMIYKKDGDKKGRLAVYMNDEKMFDLPTDRYQKGFVGFRWNNVKFVVKNLRVKGRLDQEWAKTKLEQIAETPDGADEDDDLDF